MTSLRRRILEHQVLLGTWLNLGSPLTAEIAGLAGFDWVLIDREHGGADEKEVAHQIMAAELGGTAPVVRVASINAPEIKRSLDCAAAGVMAPGVDTAEQAEALLNAVRIPPLGQRGAASSTRASRYGFGYQHYLETANDTLVTMAQIESVEAVRNSAAIAHLDGIDVLFVGPTDLSASLGLPTAAEGVAFWEAVESISRVARDAGKAAGILARNQEQAGRYLELGYTVIALESDRGLLTKGFRSAVQGFRNSHRD